MGRGHGDIGVPGGVVVTVGPVVVRGDERAVGSEGGGLPELVGAGLFRTVGHDRQLPGIDDRAGEGTGPVGGHAVKDVVVAATGFDAGVDVDAVGGEPRRGAAAVFVGVPVDVGPEGDHDPVGVGRVDPADGIIRGPEHRVAAGAGLRHTGSARVGAGP